MSANVECGRRRRHATIQTAHIVHARTPGRTLEFGVSAVCDEPRITVVAYDDGTAAVGGFIGLRDVRRLARAIATGAANTYLGLRPWGTLPGGRLTVEQEGGDVYLVAVPLEGAPRLFGPLPAAAVAALCRDVVGWTRLLVRSGAPEASA